mgnify:CR=1 FL=1
MTLAKPQNKGEREFIDASHLLDAGDARHAAILFKRAADRGSMPAQMMLGYLYDTGAGVSRSREKALAWYGRAARRGDATAAANIGSIFAKEGNKRSALRWFMRAVDQGLPDVLLDIAKMQKPSDAKKTLQRLLNHKRIIPDVRQNAAALLTELKRR